MISLILLLLAGIAKAFMDVSSEDRYFHPWFNKSQSSHYKYKFKPNWLFTTVLVWVTDFWHLMQMMYLNLFMASVIFYERFSLTPHWWLDFIIYGIALRGMFEIVYTIIKLILLKK